MTRKISHPRRLVVVAVAVAAAAAGCGSGSASKSPQAGRTVSVEMTSFAFSPATFQVSSGTTVVFRFHNADKVAHEAFLGDQAAQDTHDMDMARPGGMGAMHDANEVEVAPGATKTVSYHFDKPGTLILGCHEPAHYAAGMKATITVT